MSDTQKSPQEVTVTDIKIPFGSMVTLLVKLVLASIPALIILIIFGAFASAVLVGVFSRSH